MRSKVDGKRGWEQAPGRKARGKMVDERSLKTRGLCFALALAAAASTASPSPPCADLSAGTWRLRSANTSAVRLNEVLACPLLDLRYRERMRAARLRATGGLLPRFVPACRDQPRPTAQAWLSLLASRTLVFVGDSVAEQHFHSLACHLLTGEQQDGERRSPRRSQSGRARRGLPNILLPAHPIATPCSLLLLPTHSATHK